MKAIKYKIKPVTDKIFALEIPNDWDRAMVFLRSQEFYESKESQFRGKDFDIWDYMKWYAENMSGSCSFSYPNDWAAYNLPISVIVKCLDKQKTQMTPYDIIMDEVLGQIFNKYGVNEHDTYLIGVREMKGRELLHEMSHALWHTDSAYQKRAKALLKKLPAEAIEKGKNRLSAMGYTKAVLMDEIMAYSATGDMALMLGESVAAQHENEFMDLLEEFLPEAHKQKKVA